MISSNILHVGPSTNLKLAVIALGMLKHIKSTQIDAHTFSKSKTKKKNAFNSYFKNHHIEISPSFLQNVIA